ncbi:unnamed protein product, partial [Adineta ricciae]
SVNDLCRPWIYDVLRSVQFYGAQEKAQIQRDETNHTYIPTLKLSSFSQLVLNGHFPHLEFAFTGAESEDGKLNRSTTFDFIYKFLIGFDRQKIQTSYFKNSSEALDFLLKQPHQAIMLMLQEIENRKENITGESMFAWFTNKLGELEKKEEANLMPAFYGWTVGLDLFGDESGFPYCPFVAPSFINYIQKRRKISKETPSLERNLFGVRVHCGENVMFADTKIPGYRLFIAHMYIVFRCLLFLQKELQYGIRIGHGIAFDRIFDGTMSKLRYRKSSVILADIQERAQDLMKTIAFEVNITSNEYLLGQTLRRGDAGRPLRLGGLFDRVPIILATDDDGVWPIDHCAFIHPGHHSLTAEYCRAISSGLIDKTDQLQKILQNTRDFCFWNMGGSLRKPSKPYYSPQYNHLGNTIIIHPDILRRLQRRYNDNPTTETNYTDRFFFGDLNANSIKWKHEAGVLRVVFTCICTGGNMSAEQISAIRNDYSIIFGQDENQFDLIHSFWKDVRSEFMSSNHATRSHDDLGIGHKVELKFDDANFLVYANPKHGQLQDSPERCLCEFIHQKRGSKHTIYAFVDTIDTEKMVKLLEQRINSGVSEQYNKMALFIYTNTNIYEYVSHGINKDFTLIVNPHSSKRKKSKQCFLYTLCSSASAATAALHLIAEMISRKLSSQGSKFTPGQAHPAASMKLESPIPVSRDATDEASEEKKHLL